MELNDQKNLITLQIFFVLVGFIAAFTFIGLPIVSCFIKSDFYDWYTLSSIFQWLTFISCTAVIVFICIYGIEDHANECSVFNWPFDDYEQFCYCLDESLKQQGFLFYNIDGQGNDPGVFAYAKVSGVTMDCFVCLRADGLEYKELDVMFDKCETLFQNHRHHIFTPMNTKKGYKNVYNKANYDPREETLRLTMMIFTEKDTVAFNNFIETKAKQKFHYIMLSMGIALSDKKLYFLEPYGIAGLERYRSLRRDFAKHMKLTN